MLEPILAVFSDVHSNLEALQAVLKDMEGLNVRPSICLGDVVGYSASPATCLEHVRELGCQVLKGNHDAMVADDEPLAGISDTARAGIEFARRKLTREQRQYLGNLPLLLAEGDCEFVHASLEEPSDWWYVVDGLDAMAHFSRQSRPICFCGHTHVPFVWRIDRQGELAGTYGEGRIELPAEGRVLINVGSVGQPRDQRPEACYALYHQGERWVEFRRVPYDLEKTRRKILKAELPRQAADRLVLGR